LLGLLSTGFLFSGCVSYPVHNGYYSPPVRSSVIIGVYDYPRYEYMGLVFVGSRTTMFFLKGGRIKKIHFDT